MKSTMVALVLVLAVASQSRGVEYANDQVKEEIVALEKSSWRAYANHDAKAYLDTATDDATFSFKVGEVLSGKQYIMAHVISHHCYVKSFEMGDAKVLEMSPDSAILIYHLTHASLHRPAASLAQPRAR